MVATSAFALVGCETTKETNSNKAVVVNDNTKTVNTNMMNANGMNTNMATNDRVDINPNITREEYDKDKDKYEKMAKGAGATIGSSAEDGWLWTKTRAALLATNDLRESTIDVDVENSVVSLRGSVATKAQMEKAESVAKGIEGVKKVTNLLKVSAEGSMATDSEKKVNTNTNMK